MRTTEENDTSDELDPELHKYEEAAEPYSQLLNQKM